jgi:hypothetical protein
VGDLEPQLPPSPKTGPPAHPAQPRDAALPGKKKEGILWVLPPAGKERVLWYVRAHQTPLPRLGPWNAEELVLKSQKHVWPEPWKAQLSPMGDTWGTQKN